MMKYLLFSHKVWFHLFFFILLGSTPFLAFSPVSSAPSSPSSSSSSFSAPPLPESYEGNFDPATFVEAMHLQPIFSPDNAMDTIVSLLNSANISIDVELQYIRQFNSTSWDTDSNPLMQALIAALDRGVDVRVVLEEAADTDNASLYLVNHGASVVFLNELNWNHNKGIIIDSKIVIVSSANWSKTSMTRNREAGLVIYNENIAQYFETIFSYDFLHGTPVLPLLPFKSSTPPSSGSLSSSIPQNNPTNISAPLFEGTFNVTAFSNPDSAYDVILPSLQQAKHSIYVEIYSMSLNDIKDTLISLKEANPSLDIKIILSSRRFSYWEDVYSYQFADALVSAGIEVFNSSDEWSYTHAKYWMIDGVQTIVYSGNWAGSSITPPDESPGNGNREWGVLINDATITEFYESVFFQDLALAVPYKPNASQFSFLGLPTASVLSGDWTISVLATDADSVTLYLDDTMLGVMNASGSNLFTYSLDTRLFSNGIHELKAVTSSYSPISVRINIINEDQWGILISEVLYDGEEEPDDEFIELENLFSFDVLLEGWILTDGEGTFTLPTDALLPAHDVLVFAANSSRFASLWDFSPDFSYSDLLLANTGDNVVLLDVTNLERDAVVWGSASHLGTIPITTPTGELNSLQRVPITQDTNNCSADFIIAPPTPGELNAPLTSSTPPSSSTTLSSSSSSSLPASSSLPLGSPFLFSSLFFLAFPVLSRRYHNKG